MRKITQSAIRAAADWIAAMPAESRFYSGMLLLVVFAASISIKLAIASLGVLLMASAMAKE